MMILYLCTRALFKGRSLLSHRSYVTIKHDINNTHNTDKHPASHVHIYHDHFRCFPLLRVTDDFAEKPASEDG